MNRRHFLCGLTLGAIAGPLAAEAQQAGRVYRVGFVTSGSPPVQEEALEIHLRDLGWIESRNLVIEYRFADGKIDRLGSLVADLLRVNVDVIIAWDTPAALAAKRATQTVPIVITAGSPVRTGLVTNLARPGGNITGLAVQTTDLRPKTLQLLTETVPNASRVGYLVMPGNPATVFGWEDIRAVAPARGVELRRYDAGGSADIERAFASMARERVGGLILTADPLFFSHHKLIIELAAKTRVPVIYPYPAFVEAGGLMSYGTDARYVNQLVANYVHRILQGAHPGDLPIESPAKVQLVINLKTAKALGLTIPQSVLFRADQVIE